VSIVSAELDVVGFIAKPNPFDDEVTFAFAEGSSGLATEFTVSIYDLSGHLVKSLSAENADEITWDGTNAAGLSLANGAYIYVAMATDGTDTFTGKGTVFIKR
jgi:flagellar hook assembly protein FlgD